MKKHTVIFAASSVALLCSGFLACSLPTQKQQASAPQVTKASLDKDIWCGKEGDGLWHAYGIYEDEKGQLRCIKKTGTTRAAASQAVQSAYSNKEVGEPVDLNDGVLTSSKSEETSVSKEQEKSNKKDKKKNKKKSKGCHIDFGGDNWGFSGGYDSEDGFSIGYRLRSGENDKLKNDDD